MGNLEQDRFSLFETLPEEIKEYSERVAHNAQILFLEMVKQEVYPDYSDLVVENVKYIKEAVKYFDVGFALKDDKNRFPDKVIPVNHVRLGSEIFFADIKKREDFKKLTKEEKIIRRLAKEAAGYHHEKWNGKGYPVGLKMEEIPIIARICSICLYFEEITSSYNNKKPLGKYESLKYINELSGIDFDPKIVDIFQNVLPLLAIKGEPLIYKNDEELIIENNVEEVLEEETKKEEIKEEKVTKPSKGKTKNRPIEVLFSTIEDVKARKIIYFKTETIINDRYLGAIKPVVYSQVAEKYNRTFEILQFSLEQIFKFIDTDYYYDSNANGVFVKIYPSIIEKETNFNKLMKVLEGSSSLKELIFEIPESVLVSPNSEIKKALLKLKRKGIRIAICDFGLEYSALSKLSEIDFDIVVINHKFVKEIEKNTKVAGIVRGIVDLIRSMGAEEICEGVTLQEQVEVLNKLGCKKLQGSIISEPKSLKEL